MENKQLVEQFFNHRKKINALKLALSTMYYDMYTIAPKKGNPYRQEMMALLSTQAFMLSQDKAYIEWTKTINKTTQDADLKRETDLILKKYNKTKNVSEELMMTFNIEQMKANDIWEEAKETNNYQLFEPQLKKLIDLTKEVVSTIQPKVNSVYESLLDDYEEGLTIETLDYFFKILEERLVPFIQKVNEANLAEPEFLSRSVSIDQQKKITQLLRDYMGFNNDFSVVAETEHPFSSTLSINDTRITTHYHENLFTSNIFSVIHEFGHSFYNHQVDQKYEGWVIGDAMSMGMHESQSRFLENNIGRSKSFWVPIYDQLKELAQEALYDVDLDEFIRGINYPKLSLIRIEADELTYALHVLVRYRLEQKMFVDNETDNLNDLWNQQYQQILGITPDSDTNGILQDVHWSGASFGYFPTYALGSAYAAQFYQAMNQEFDVNQALEDQDFNKIKTWLKENIHQTGGFYNSNEMLLRVTNKAFDPHIFCDYLINKYTNLFNL